MYVVCAGTNTQQLIDLLKMMSGDLDEPDNKANACSGSLG